MDLNEILIFTRVVESLSFTSAARDLGIPKSTVSRKVALLEERLGAALLHRTTRKLELTAAGATYFRHCTRIIADLEAAEQAVAHARTAPHGPLRFAAPLHLGEAFLGQWIAEFMALYPQVRVDLLLSEQIVDVVKEGFDLALRLGEFQDPRLLSRPLGKVPTWLVAAPGYLEQHPPLEQLDQLADHRCLVLGSGVGTSFWTLRGARGPRRVQVQAALASNNLTILRDAAIACAGIALLPASLCAEAITAGDLVTLLPENASPALPLHVVYPTTRHLSPAVLALLEYLSMRLDAPPWQTVSP